MKKNRTFKIIYLPEHSSKIKEFNLSRSKLFIISLLISSLLVLLTIYSLNFIIKEFDSIRYKNVMSKPVAEKIEELENLSENLNEISLYINGLKREIEIEQENLINMKKERIDIEPLLELELKEVENIENLLNREKNKDRLITVFLSVLGTSLFTLIISYLKRKLFKIKEI